MAEMSLSAVFSPIGKDTYEYMELGCMLSEGSRGDSGDRNKSCKKFKNSYRMAQGILSENKIQSARQQEGNLTSISPTKSQHMMHIHFTICTGMPM